MLLSSVSYHTNCKWKPFPSLQPTCPLLFAFVEFLLKMASKKPKSPPKLRLSGHPVRNSVFVTIGNCKRPQILRSEFFSSVTHWCLLRPVFVTSGSSLLTTLTSVSNAFTDFWGLTYFLSKFYQTNQQVSISLLSKIMDFLKVLIESIYCCEEWTMIKNLRIVSRVFLFLAII